MTTFDIERDLDGLIAREGGYVDHPSDKGGPTCWGITEAVARANGFRGSMRALPKDLAKAIYRSRYWTGPRFDKIAWLSAAIAAEMFDTGVNMGPGVPSIWLQEWLNAFNDGGRLYPDIKEDGDIGPATLKTLGLYLAKRGAEAETVMVRALNCDQGVRYKGLSRSRLANEAFAYGWLRARVGVA